MTGSRFASLRLLVLVLAVTSGCSQTDPFDTPWPGQPAGPSIEIVVDFTRARDDRIPVSMRLTGFEGDAFRFRLRGNKGEYRVHDVRFTDGHGRAIEYEHRNIVWDLAPFEGNVIQDSTISNSNVSPASKASTVSTVGVRKSPRTSESLYSLTSADAHPTKATM